MDVLDLRDTVLDVLAPLGVDITDGDPTPDPSDGRPRVVHVDSAGRVRRTVIITVTSGVAGNRRASGASVDRDGYVNALIVTASRSSCLWLVQAVQDALADFPLGNGQGRLTDASYDGDPAQEPDTEPARWSQALAFTITRKRSR